MPRIMHRDLLRFIWISNFPNLSFEPLMKAYIKKQLFTSVAICLCFIWWMNFVWKIFGFKQWRIIRRVVKWNAYVKAAILISIAYVTLLVVNTRYISAVIIPITVLVFIGALYVVIAPKGSLKSDEGNHNVAKKADDVGTASKADGNGGVDDRDNGLFATAVLPCWVLCCMGHFNVDNLVVSQFLLFLTSTLGELTLMMARLPAEVALAFEVIRRASLVVVLVTAHTMAAELLGDDVVLACTPELITGLLWFGIHFGHGGGSAAISVDKHGLLTPLEEGVEEEEKGGRRRRKRRGRGGGGRGRRREPPLLASSASATVDKVTSYKAGAVVLGAAMAILACLAASTDGSEEATNLLSRYTSVLVDCAFSVILPSLCVFALRQWPGKTTVEPSSELEGAIRLLSFCRNIMFIATAAFLVVKPLVDVRLGLQVQELVAGILNKFVDGCVTWFFIELEPIFRPYYKTLI